MDRQVADALLHVVGHGPPFSDEELAGIEKPVEILAASDLDGLQQCSGLRELTLFACNTPQLDVLRSLPGLTKLRLGCLPVEDLSPLAELHSLVELHINFTCASEGPPLAGLKNLTKLVLIGNPWGDAAWAQLQGAGELSEESHWRLTRRLFDRGIRLCYGARKGYAPALVIPASGTAYVADFIEVPEDAVGAALAAAEEGIDTDSFFFSFDLKKPGEPPMRQLLG